jgi:hypothetical protein
MRKLVNGVWGYVRGMRLRLVKRLNTKKGNVMIGKMMSLPPLFTYSAIVVYLLSCEFLLTLS